MIFILMNFHFIKRKDVVYVKGQKPTAYGLIWLTVFQLVCLFVFLKQGLF